MPDHSKIINKISKEILKPHGLVRKGQSRSWYDDHGWYTIQVEFQPFSGRQGTCINVGASFHWYPDGSMSFDFGYRESEFVFFVSEEQFAPEVTKLAEKALQKVLEYRENFSTLTSAKAAMVDHEFTSESLWGNYHRGMICGLTGDAAGTHQYFDALLSVDHDVEWANELKEHVLQLKAIVNDANSFRTHIQTIAEEVRRVNKLPPMPIFSLID